MLIPYKKIAPLIHQPVKTVTRYGSRNKKLLGTRIVSYPPKTVGHLRSLAFKKPPYTQFCAEMALQKPQIDVNCENPRVTNEEICGSVKSSLSDNDFVSPEYVNRNPRSLELMKVGMKQEGWGTSWPRRDWHHALRMEQTRHYTSAWVQDPSGHVVVKASNREWAIAQFLYAGQGINVNYNVGRVIADRMKLAGISHCFCELHPSLWYTEKAKAFLRGVEEQGITLQEPDRERVYRRTEMDNNPNRDLATGFRNRLRF